MTAKIIMTLIAWPLATLLSQELPPGQLDPTSVAEELFAQQDLDLNYEELYESVMQYLAAPVDLNKASAEQLKSLCLLNDRQINELIAHRNTNGDFLSIYELQSLDSFDPEVIRYLSLFTQVVATDNPARLIRRIFSEPNNYLLLRYERLLEHKAGFQDSQDSAHRFAGAPDKYLARFRVSHPGDFSLGFILEKDPGESKVSDYYSLHFQRTGGKTLTNLIAGDFQAFFGQGLVLGGGFGMGKGAETILTMRRSTLGFLPWTSTAECGYFRGAGASVALAKNFRVHGLLSRTMQDGILRTDSITGKTIASLLASGLHRNTIEGSRQKTVGENNLGLIVEYRNRGLQLGLTSLYTMWNALLTNSPAVYNRTDPFGSTCTNVGAFLNYSVRNYSFFGEAAHTLGWGTGVVGGALVSVSPGVDVALLARHYSRDFWSPYGSAVSENSTARNESAIYWGWKFQAFKKLGFAGYLDLFHFPWMQYRLYTTSSQGHDLLVRMNWRPRKEVNLITQVREERKARNDNGGFTAYHASVGIKRNYCLGIDFSSGQLVLKTRIQGSTLKTASRTGGMAIIQDIGLDRRHWSLHLRQCLFDTDDFDNRQYTYEPDMWMAYSFPAYYGRGIRTGAMARVGLGRHADLWVRWARTFYEDRSSTGSGVDAVEGPVRNDLKIQFRLKL